MNLNNWVNQAKAHWKEFSPKLYRELKKAGTLDAKAREAAERTNAEMNELRAPGYQEHEAWEIVRERYLLTAPESPEAEKLDSPFLRLSREVNKAQNETLRRLRGNESEDE